MNEIIEWIIEERAMLFSGAAFAIISAIAWLFKRKSGSANITASKSSVAAQTIKNSRISTGDTKE